MQHQHNSSNAIKLSVIVTVKNEVSSIATFIESLLNQSLKPDEIIIVDGNSNDGTQEILNKFEAENKIRMLVRECNIAEGRNFAIANTINEYIAVTDAGCVVDNNWLIEIAKAFETPDNPDVVAGNFQFDCHNVFEETVVLSTFNPERAETEAAIYYPSSRSVAFKKCAWEQAKGYPEWLYAAEDTLFNIRLRQLNFKFVFAKKALVTWRPRETWKALAKQRFNFSRGNARVGIGTEGYMINIKYHGLILVFLLLSMTWSWMMVFSIYPMYLHIKNNLWSQAKKATRKSNRPNIFWRVLLVMEFVRLMGIVGFIRGRLDRYLNKHYIENQMQWMGIKTLDDLEENYRA